MTFIIPYFRPKPEQKIKGKARISLTRRNERIRIKLITFGGKEI